MANTLDEFTQMVEKHSTAGNGTMLSELVNNSLNMLVSNVSSLDNVLNVLNVNDHSIGVLAVIYAKLSQIKPPELLSDNFFFNQIVDFAFKCNKDQINYVPELFADVYHMFTNIMIKLGESRKAIHTVYEAVCKLQESPTHLTTLHAEMCRLCLHAMNLKPALKLLDNDITAMSNEGGPLTFDAKYFLLYFYYGGIIYAALKDYERAHYFFEVAITTPAVVASHIMIEAYKKYVLISLILDGKGILCNSPTILPKQVSQVVARIIKPVCQVYIDIANAYTNGNCEQIFQISRKNNFTLKKDKNLGLACQVCILAYKKNIKRLTKTFVTLSLDDVAKRAKLPDAKEAEEYVIDMISENEICADIDKAKEMVAFRDPQPKYNNPKALKEIEDQIKECIRIEKQIAFMDEEISLNTTYLKKLFGGLEDDITHSKLCSSNCVL